jgi:hypothetical protein
VAGTADESGVPAFLLCAALVCLMLGAPLLGACDPDSGPSPDGSASVNASPEHAFPEQGFSLRYGPRWKEEVQPPSDGWRWTLILSDTMGASPGGIGTRGRIAVTAEANRGQSNAAQYQKVARPLLNRMLVKRIGDRAAAADDGSGSVIHHLFRPTTVNGVPALVAAIREGDARNGTEAEWYVVGAREHNFSIVVSSPAATWDDEAPALQDVVDTFTILKD